MPSYNYAVGRVKALEARMFDALRLRRMVGSGLDEFLKAAQEAGYGEGSLPGGDMEEVLNKNLCATRQMIMAVTPDPEITGLFLLPVDARNLKVLLKARLQNISPAGLLEDGGLFPLALLQRAVGEKYYGDLPASLKGSMEDLEKSLLRSVSPQLLSVLVDGAIFAYIKSVLDKTDSDYAIKYFSLLSDLTNLSSFLRARALCWEESAFSPIFVVAGSIPRHVFLQAFSLPDEQLVPALSRGANAAAVGEVLGEYLNKNSAPEKKIALLLRQFVLRRRNDLTDIGPIAGYLLGKETEVKALGVIFNAITRGVEADLPEV